MQPPGKPGTSDTPAALTSTDVHALAREERMPAVLVIRMRCLFDTVAALRKARLFIFEW